MHRTIVVAISEGRPRHDAFALGVALARPRGAEIVVTHVDTASEMPDGALDELVAEAPRDMRVRTVPVAARAVVDGLERVVSQENAELLVIGASLRTTVARLDRGDVAVHVVRDAPCAIAAAPLGYAARAPVAPRRIAVAWDGGAESVEAVEWAVQLAERTAGSLQIITVLDPTEDEPAARSLLEELRRAAADRVPATADVRHGKPARALAGGAELDLLVLGSRGRGPVARVVLGSVSADVLHHAACPVVVLPRGVHAPVETTV
jgi:nucleotide-binding universal stress UspA family protein